MGCGRIVCHQQARYCLYARLRNSDALNTMATTMPMPSDRWRYLRQGEADIPMVASNAGYPSIRNASFYRHDSSTIELPSGIHSFGRKDRRRVQDRRAVMIGFSQIAYSLSAAHNGVISEIFYGSGLRLLAMRDVGVRLYHNHNQDGSLLGRRIQDC